MNNLDENTFLEDTEKNKNELGLSSSDIHNNSKLKSK